MNCTGVMSSESTHFSTTSWPTSSANAAEKIGGPIRNQHTMAPVFSVRNDDSLMILSRSFQG